MRVLTENIKPMTVIIRARIFLRRTLPRGTVHRKKFFLVLVKLGQIRLGSVRFFSFFTVNCPYGQLSYDEKS